MDGEEEGLRGVGAIVPCVFEEHRDEGDYEEGGVDVGHEIRFGVGVVGEDSLHGKCQQLIKLLEGM